VVIQGWQPEADGIDADVLDADLPAPADAAGDELPAHTDAAGDRRDPAEDAPTPAQTEDEQASSTQVDDQRDARAARFQPPAPTNDEQAPVDAAGEAGFQPPAQPNTGYRPPFVRDMSLFTRPMQPAQPEDKQQGDSPRQPTPPTPIQAPLLDHELEYQQPGLQRTPRQLAETRWPEPPTEHATDDDTPDQLAADPPPAAPAPQPASARPATTAQPDSAQPAPHLPSLRALAQLAQTYLLTEGPNGALFLIDQHAAHERITYERLLSQHAAGLLQSQTLLLPQYVALPPSAQQALLVAADELADWGFMLAEADGGVDVLAVPADLALETLETTLPDLASHLGGSAGHGPNARRDAMLATLACHTSVRAGQTLSSIEQQALIDQLAGCEGPRTCPHGRPTLIVLTKHQLEHQFGRLGA
nr:hypothetical protein [Chloroflexota bacterium]